MKPFFKKMMLLLATLLVCALIVEVFFRIYWPYKSIYVSDNQLNYKPAPDFNGTYKSPEGEWKFWTNKEGFVNQNPAKEKRPGTERIFVVGDSFVEGLYTDRNKHFTTLLQNKLNNQTGRKYEVVSYGTSSWGTDNEYKYITTQGLSYSPDIIILEYYQNDFENVAVSRLFRIENGKVVPTYVGGTGIGNIVKKIVTKCSFYSAFCSYFQIHAGGFKILHPLLAKLGFSVATGNASTIDFKKDPYLRNLPAEERRIIDGNWNKTEMLLNAIKEEAGKKNAQLVIAYVPARWEVEEAQHSEFLQSYNLTQNQTDMTAFADKLREISIRNGIRMIDPTDTFAREEKEGKTLYLSFVHFTEEGDRLFAEALYEGLLEAAKYKNTSEVS